MCDRQLGRIGAYSVTILLVVLALAGCTVALPPVGTPQSTPGGTLPSAATNPLANTAWQFATLSNREGETAALAGSTVTLEFGADGQAGGNAGCNTYGGSYQVQGDALTFDELVSTLMACMDESVMQQEQLYLQALQSATRFAVSADHLTIWSDDDDSELRFTPLATDGSAEASTGNLPDDGTADMAERVEFDPGATSATLSGTLPVGGIKKYALAGSAGQTIHVQTVGDDAPVSFMIDGPGSTSWAGEPQASDVYIFTAQVTLPENGDYLVTLSVPTDATETRYDVVFTIDMSASSPVTPQPGPVDRVQFASGTTSTERSGLLPTGPNVQQYLLSANTDQIMAVDATSDGTPLSMTIESPSGNRLIPEMMPAEDGYTIGREFTVSEPGYYLVTLTKDDHTPSTNYTITFTLQ